MKRGLVNLLMLVLLLTNIILTAIIVFAVVPAMNNANDLVEKVASAINLEKENKSQYTDDISIDDAVLYEFSNKLTVAVNSGGDSKIHYAQFDVTLTLDKQDETYDDYKDMLLEKEKLMISEIGNVVAKYTIAEIQNNKEAVLEEITLALRKLFNNSTFIYKTTFSNTVYM